MSAQSVPLITPEEYLEFDRASDVNNEYVSGEIAPMTGGTPWHGLLTANVAHLLNKSLFGGPCLVFSSSLRVCVDRQTLYSYPDVTVVCGALEYVDGKKDTVTNPRIVVEVLSPSTRNYDLGDKARAYWRIPSLSDLFFIEQDRIGVEHWRKLPNSHWELETVAERQATIQIESAGCELAVAEIYSGHAEI
jgi:Uma2 family endonuclease